MQHSTRFFSALVAASGFLVPAIAPGVLAQATYSDIEGHWAQQCIQNLSQQGIVSGYPNGTFRPNAIINRAEFAALVNKAFPDVAAERSAINFQDVSADYWGQEAIQTAYRKGFLAGYPGRVFRPTQLIPRVQAFVALASGLDYPIPDQPQQLLNATFKDAAEIPAYGEGKIAAAVENDILISPPKPQFEQRLMGPSDPATRAQVAAALCQVKGIAGVPSQYVVQPGGQAGGGSDITLGQTCTNETIGYTVRYPTGWVTNSGGVLPQCQVFDSDAVQLEEATDDLDEAVYFDLENIPYNELVSRLGGPTSQILSRRQTTVNGRQAVVKESEATGPGLLPPGRRVYAYYIDFKDQTLVVRTYSVPSQPYQTNKQVLDQMVKSLGFTRAAVDLPADVRTAVLDDIASRTGSPKAEFTIVEAQEETWPNGCLGLAKPGEVCTQALVPGWRVVVSRGQQRWVYRTDQAGNQVRLATQLS